MGKPRLPGTPDNHEEVIRLGKRGCYTIGEIANLLDLTPVTVWTYWRRWCRETHRKEDRDGLA